MKILISLEKELWSQILSGKRSWKADDLTSEACDQFESERVRPLRKLQEDGLIRLIERRAPVMGKHRVRYVFVHLVDTQEKQGAFPCLHLSHR